MKFENVKVNDVVYMQERISTGWNSAKSFWRPFKVEKVTPTQFTANGRRFKKERGQEIGSSSHFSYCSYLGESYGYGGDSIVEDETESRDSLVKTIKQINLIEKIKDNIKLSIESENIDLIYNLLAQVESLLPEKELKRKL